MKSQINIQIANNNRAEQAKNKETKPPPKKKQKNCKEDIAYIRNLFALLTVWIKPIRLDSKLGEFRHETLSNWILFKWDRMMPKDLESFIKKHGIFKKLDQLPLKETFAINLILKFMDDRHFDQEMMSLVVVNHNSYRLIFSTVCKIIYFHRSKCHIQNIFVDDLRRRKIAKGEQRKKHLLSSNPHEQIQMIKIDPYEVKIDHVPLTEAVNVHKEEKPGLQHALKKRLHEMNKSEKKSKEIPRQFFVEKHIKIL